MDDREKAAHYRKLAAQLKEAARSPDLEPATRQAMLELAKNYKDLAGLLEQLA